VKFPLRSVVLTLIGALSLITLAIPPCVAGRNVSQETQQPDASGDGQHDFDFNLGTWKTHVSRLLHPLSGSSTRAEYDGTSVVNKVWGGRANLLELEVDGPAGHIEGAGLRLYNPRSHQWSLNWASSADGDMEHPVIGRFAGGRGEFFDHEVINGKSVLVRNTFSDISQDFARFEQAFSADGGRSWETNWIITFARIPESADAAAPHSPSKQQPLSTAAVDGQHDFDFAFGTWKTHIKRLTDPLSGSTHWAEYDGTHTIRRVWGGRGNLGELEADGPEGHLEALSPRFFNPQTRLWSVSYANPRDGTLSAPVVGEFSNGRGEFYGEDTLGSKAILVREVYSHVDAATRRLEIAYSDNGGRSWETNWIMTDTLVSATTGQSN
jgi:hypothetical protein